MASPTNLAGKVIFMTGGSRGIGRSIALRAARDGANIVLAAKTAKPNPKLPGTIYTVAEEIEKHGGRALPCVVDIRYEEQVENAISSAIKHFGGIDILVNNASAISLTKTTATSMKSFDLLNNINTRGTFLCSKMCIPILKNAENPHILTLSPPLNMSPKWFSNHLAYTISKYGMSMCVLGLAKELRSLGIAVNALWPRTAIYTAATKMIGGGEQFAAQCRTPEIMSDAAHSILIRSSKDAKNTGNFFVDEDVLRNDGVTDFDQYAIKPGNRLALDFYLDDEPAEVPKPKRDNQSTAMGVEEAFKKMRNLLSEDLVKKVGASFYFTLSGPEPGRWFLDLSSGKGCLGKAGDDPAKYDCHFEMSSDKFLEMFRGRLAPSKAFMAGELSIDGDVFSAFKLESFFGKLNS